MEDSGASFLQRLMAERAMYETTCRMFRLVDGREYDRVGPECFTEASLIEYDLTPEKGPDSVMRLNGREMLTRHLIDATQHQIQHHAHVVGQVIFDWSGARPKLSAHVFALHWFSASRDKGDMRPADWIALGVVTDQFEEIGGQWLIAQRLVSPAGGPVVAGSAFSEPSMG